jgi:hypothetical protein
VEHRRESLLNVDTVAAPQTGTPGSTQTGTDGGGTAAGGEPRADSVEQGQGAASQGSTGTGQQTATPSQAPRSAPNLGGDGIWQSRYQGAQSLIAQQRQQVEQTNAQLAQVQQRMIELQGRIQGMPPETIAQHRQIAAQTARLNQERIQLQEQSARMREDHAQLERAAVHIVAQQKAAFYGVPIEKLSGLPSPDDMDVVGEALRDAARTTTNQERRAANKDKVESTGGSGIDISKMTPVQRIAYGLKNRSK